MLEDVNLKKVFESFQIHNPILKNMNNNIKFENLRKNTAILSQKYSIRMSTERNKKI